MKIVKLLKAWIYNYWWILLISLITLIIFLPTLNFNLTLQDMEVFYFINYHFGYAPLLIKFPISYYFSQYGTLYITIDIIHQLFKYDSILYYIFNISLRILSALSIFLLTKKWTKNPTAAFFSAVTFTVAYPGLESTTWPTQFLAYLGVIMMFVYLSIWKGFHDKPNGKLAKLSVAFFSLTIFISHIRVFALPFIIFPFEIYYLLRNKKKKYQKLQILHLISLLMIFAIFYFGTNIMRPTPELAGKITQASIFARALLTGHPPVLASFFLFVSFLLPSYQLVATTLNKNLLSTNSNIIFLIAFLLSSTSTIIYFVLLIKRNMKSAFGITAAIIYPFVLYFVGKELLSEGWTLLWLTATLIGGEILIYILLDIFVIKKHDVAYLEIISLGILILSLHLFLHWISVPLLEFNDQAAYSFFSRYYTIPVSGISIVVGTYMAIAINQIKESFKKRNILLVGANSIIILAVLLSYFGNTVQITQQLQDIKSHNNNVTYQKLWNTLQPYFNSIQNRDRKIIFYYEGANSPEEIKILSDYFPYRLSEEMNYTNNNKPTTMFTNSKTTLLTLIKTEKLDKNQIFAFKLENVKTIDIKNQVLKEIIK